MARHVLQHTDAPNANGLADSARELAEAVMAYFSKIQTPGTASTAPPSFREIKRLVKAFSEKGSNPENPRTGESSLPAESLPKPTPASVPQRRRPPVASTPARAAWEGPGLFPAS